MNHRPRRRFGQHFLDSEAVLEDDGATPGLLAATIPVLEIGPGEGALTRHLIAASNDVTVVEIDRDLVALLKQRFPALRIIEADVSASGPRAAADAGSPRRRQSAVQHLDAAVCCDCSSLLGEIRDLHFLLQKEVVDRLAASPGTKDWGRLSILAQYAARVEPLFDVGPENFRPPPKVMSTFVRITPRPNPLPLRSSDALVVVFCAPRFSSAERRCAMHYNPSNSIGTASMSIRVFAPMRSIWSGM